MEAGERFESPMPTPTEGRMVLEGWARGVDLRDDGGDCRPAEDGHGPTLQLGRHACTPTT